MTCYITAVKQPYAQYISGQLCPEFVAVARNSARAVAEPGIEVYAPNFYFRSIVYAAYLRRCAILDCQPQPKLANRAVLPHPDESTPARILRSIINQGIDATSTPSAPCFAARMCHIYEGACRQADKHFANLIGHIDNDTVRQNAGARIIHDQGKPLLVQKGQGTPTALSLAPLAVEKIVYPAGSLFGIHLDEDYGQHTGRYSPSFTPGLLEFRTADAVVGLDYIRPSVLGLTLNERRPYIPETSEAYSRFSGAHCVFAEDTMNDIVDVFQSVIPPADHINRTA